MAGLRARAIGIYLGCAVIALAVAALAIYLDVLLHTGPFLALAAGLVLGSAGVRVKSRLARDRTA